MPGTLKERLAKDLEKIQTQARAIAEKDDQTDADKKNLESLLKDGQEIQARAESLLAVDAMDDTGQSLTSVQRREERPADDRPTGLGDMFTRSQEWGRYQQAPTGTSGRVAIPIHMFERAPLLTTSGTGTPWTSPDRIEIARPARATPLLDLVQRVPVSSNSVDWVTYPAAAPLAAIVPENTAKPEATITAAVATVTLDTIAHWAQATRQLLEDSSAARAFIDGELSRGVLDKIESEIAAAMVAATLPTATDAVSLMNAIRKGVGTVQAAGFQPNAVVLNPADYAALDIDVFSKTLLGPAINGSYWGLRPVAAGAQPAGTATVGDFTAGVYYLERTAVSMYVTDSHASTFISNVFTFLAEARGKAVVTRPEALVECTKAP